jgi:hypothetical protein
VSLTLILGAMAAIAAPGAARPSGSKFTVPEVRRVQAAFASCAVANKPAKAAKFVLGDYRLDSDDRAGWALVGELSDGNCLYKASPAVGTVKMKFPGDNMRFAIADALLQRELPTLKPLDDLANVARLNHGEIDEADYAPKPGKTLKPKQMEQLTESRTKRLARIYLSNFGECIVRNDPQGIRALLMAAPTSPAENAAFAALTPGLGACVPPDATIELNKTVIRGTAASNYYRLAHAPRVAAAPTPAGAR